METSLLDQGITLMLVGMSTVFVFLTVLVGAMSLMSLVARRFLVRVDDAEITEEEVAAISAAIAQHRKKTA